MSRILTGKEREDAMLETLRAPGGQPSREQWQAAWVERHEAFLRTRDLDSLVPLYVDRGYHRHGGVYLKHGPGWFAIERASILDSIALYLAPNGKPCAECVVEIGCGTGFNLARLKQWRRFSDSRFIGLDWDTNISGRFQQIREIMGFEGFEGYPFDMFYPSLKIDGSVSVLTIGAMEMLGPNWAPTLNWILDKNPEVVIHSEPIYELYDQSTLFDYVAAQYHEKRGYLKGYYPELQRLAADKKIEILEVTKQPGSCHHDGSTIVVWRPL